MTARTPEFELEYKKAKRSGKLPGLHGEKILKKFTYWRYIKCKFHHNKLNTEEHYLVVLDRKEKDWFGKLTNNEIIELWRDVFPWVQSTGRQYAKLNFEAMRSVKDIPHIHCCDHLPQFAQKTPCRKMLGTKKESSQTLFQ